MCSSAQVVADELVEATPTNLRLRLNGNRYYQDSTCTVGQTTWIRSFLSWIFSAELCSVVCSLFSLCLLDCPTVGNPPLAAPENKQPSLSFQGGVLTLRCLCCSCHLLSLFFYCRSPMARPPVMAGVLPTGSWSRETFSVKHKHLTPFARVKILAWRPRKLQTEQTGFLFVPLQGEKRMSALCSDSIIPESFT